jgi:hypothetical protein
MCSFDLSLAARWHGRFSLVRAVVERLLLLNFTLFADDAVKMQASHHHTSGHHHDDDFSVSMAL